ncbi:MAG: hypothetical protein Q3995_04890 [Eubacteriales bacterium]|nr:hypothetical protein [Eubacteriales bacterium]
MKKRLISLLFVFVMVMSLTANAAIQATQVRPTLSFSGTKATCEVTVVDSGKSIDATMELWCGSTLVDSWSGSSSSLLTLTGDHDVVSGCTYTLTVSGTVNGVAFTGTPVSKTCP